jgi:fused signal recognition particle receptor
LIDTAGRMNNSKPLMNELNKVVRVTKPDMKIFIGDAFTGNDAIDQA